MASGENTTTSFGNSLNDIRNAARVVREYANVMGRLADTTRLETGNGLNWNEVSLNKLTASGIEELTDLEKNPQQIVDALFTLTPTLVGMSVFTTDLAKMRIAKVVASKLGVLTENAMARKADVDMTAAAQAASTDVGTAGNPMSSDLISVARSIIVGNTIEPWDGPIAAVMKTYQLKDIQDEGVSGFGTYPVPNDSIAADWLRSCYSGQLYKTEVYTDDNISVDASDDAIAFVFASGANGAIVNVTGMQARRVMERRENIGGGAEILFATDQYATGIRQQAWIRAITSDSLTPA